MAANKYKTHSGGKIYKLWDKKNESYISSNSKSTWNSLHWVSAKLLDMEKWSHMALEFNINDYEIHEFEIIFKNKIDPNEIISAEKNRRNKKENAAKRVEELIPLILEYFPDNIGLHMAKRLYESGMMKESLALRIKPLMTEYFECEKIAR